MDRKTFRSTLLLITYAAFLVLVITQLSALLALSSKIFTALKPIFFGFAIAFILSRPCSFFERVYSKLMRRTGTGLATALAVFTAYICLLAVLTLVVTLIVPQLYDSLQSLATRIYFNLPTMQTALNLLLARLNLDSAELIGMLPPLSQMANQALNTISSALPHIVSFASGLFSSSVTLITSMVLSVYMLAGRTKLIDQFTRVLRAYTSPATTRLVCNITRLSADTFTRFVSGQLIEAVILGLLCFAGMVILHFPFAPLISMIISLFALIPVAGAFIGAILSALLLLMVSPPQALGFLVFIFVLQQLEGNLIYPKVVGNSIGLPGLWVLIAVLVGGGLFGLLGMLLGVPAASVCYTLLRQDVSARLNLTKRNEP